MTDRKYIAVSVAEWPSDASSLLEDFVGWALRCAALAPDEYRHRVQIGCDYGCQISLFYHRPETDAEMIGRIERDVVAEKYREDRAKFLASEVFIPEMPQRRRDTSGVVELIRRIPTAPENPIGGIMLGAGAVKKDRSPQDD